MATQLIPYFGFDGTTADAMRYYQSIFGGKLEMQTFAEANMADTEAIQDRVVHAQLTAEDFILMASDAHPDHSPEVVFGNSVSLSFVGADKAQLTEYFNKLCEDGKVEMPLEKQFWGDVFGACEDKFGVHWMVNITEQEG
ncbi:MAG TPA: VOC family protein [Candidatus Paceibacterota bacterium]|nr:VOC family protein [Candidatus Paceibacterota bacterium]